MKLKLVIFLFISLLLFTLEGCGSKTWWGKPSNLRKINLFNSTQGASGSFFLGSGSISGDKSSLTIYFSKEIHPGRYINESVLWEKTEVKTDASCEIPTVSFEFSSDDFHSTSKTGRVLFTCKPEQWSFEIKKPFN